MAKLGRPEFGSGGTRAGVSAGRAKITVVRPKAKPASAETIKVQKASVKKLPTRTAPKTDLSSRGNKITSASQKKAATKILDDKWEKYVDQRFDTYPGGPRADYNMANKGRGATAKKIIQNKAIVKAADKKVPIKINSAKLERNVIIKKKTK